MRDAGLAQLGFFVAKTCVFLRRGGNPAAELKTDKIDCQSPRAELETGRLRSPILTGRHRQRDYLALAQMAKRAVKQVNGYFCRHGGGLFGNQFDEKCKK